MTVDEAAKMHLYAKACEAWDEDAARTLMDGLTWDIERMATNDRLENAEHRLTSYIDRRMIQLVFSILAMNVATATAIIVALQGGR